MNESTTPLRCIIFDMDGTLTQTNQLIYESFNFVAEKFLGKRLTPKEIVALFGPPEEEAVRRIVGAAQIDLAMEEYYRFYNDRHNELARLHSGIRELLEFVKSKGVIVGLFTGKGRRTTEITLDKLGIAAFFDITISGDDVEHFKPSGDGIRKIMKRFSLKPEEVLMVGDAVADIKAAHECGVRMAAVVWDSYSKDAVMQSPTDYLFHSVAELTSWLERSLNHSQGNQ